MSSVDLIANIVFSRERSLVESQIAGSTNSLEIKQLQLDHEALKMKIAREFDKLVEIENKFYDASKIIKERLSGKK